MRRLLVLLSVVAAVVSTGALVASAGIEADPAPPPATTAYTVLFTNDADSVSTRPTLPADVGAAQGGCVADLATVDLTTGVITDLPAAPSEAQCAGDLAFAPDGTLYGIVSGAGDGGPISELTRYDTATGEGEVIGTFGPFEFSVGGAGEAPQGGITFDAAGRLFVMLGQAPESPGFDPSCGSGDQQLFWCLYRVDDPSQPEATTLIGVSEGAAQSLAGPLAASCAAVYAGDITNEDESTVVATVDTESAVLTEIGAFTEDHFLEGADFDRAGTFWAVRVDFNAQPTSLRIATIDPAGGVPIETPGPQITFNGSPEGFFVEALAVEPLDCAPPEPEPIVLAPTFTG